MNVGRRGFLSGLLAFVAAPWAVLRDSKPWLLGDRTAEERLRDEAFSRAIAADKRRRFESHHAATLREIHEELSMSDLAREIERIHEELSMPDLARELVDKWTSHPSTIICRPDQLDTAQRILAADRATGEMAPEPYRSG